MTKNALGIFEARAWVAHQCALAEEKEDEDLIPSGQDTLEHFGIDFFAVREGDDLPASWQEKAKVMEGMLNVFHSANERFIFLGLGDQQFLVVESSGSAALLLTSVNSLTF